MSEVNKFIESGILEMYVMGQTTPEETAEVEKMSVMHSEIHNEINEISIALEQYARAQSVTPDPMIEPFLEATIDYMERLKKGEVPSFPPNLHTGSVAGDYATWLSRRDLEPAEPVKDVYATIIGYTPEMTTAVVWLKYGAPEETHTSQLEKFLILEGTCDIIIGEDAHSMKPGDVMIIPLHKTHSVKVTSGCLCKFILQRAAA